MGRTPVEAGNEHREKVWLLMLQGMNAKTIAKKLEVPSPTIYQDIRILTRRSRDYVYDIAKDTHILMFQRAIEG